MRQISKRKVKGLQTESYCSKKFPKGFFKIKIKITVKIPSLAAQVKPMLKPAVGTDFHQRPVLFKKLQEVTTVVFNYRSAN